MKAEIGWAHLFLTVYPEGLSSIYTVWDPAFYLCSAHLRPSCVTSPLPQRQCKCYAVSSYTYVTPAGKAARHLLFSALGHPSLMLHRMLVGT